MTDTARCRFPPPKRSAGCPLNCILELFFHRPNDSRMLVALGECYEKLNQLVEAKKVSDLWSKSLGCLPGQWAESQHSCVASAPRSAYGMLIGAYGNRCCGSYNGGSSAAL